MVDNNVIYHGNNQNHYPKFHHEQTIQIVPIHQILLIVGGNNTCFIVPGSSALSIEVIDDDLVLGTGCK